jgi:hypothetical protein
VERLQKW